MHGHVENLNTGIERGRVNQIERQIRFEFEIFSIDLSCEPNFETFHFRVIGSPELQLPEGGSNF